MYLSDEAYDIDLADVVFGMFVIGIEEVCRLLRADKAGGEGIRVDGLGDDEVDCRLELEALLHEVEGELFAEGEIEREGRIVGHKAAEDGVGFPRADAEGDLAARP